MLVLVNPTLRTMEKVKLKAWVNVKFLTKLGRKGSAIIETQRKLQGTYAPKPCSVDKRIRHFKGGRALVKGDPREGRFSTSVIDETVAAVRQLVEENRQISVEVIAHSIGISVGSAHSIRRDQPGLSKLTA